jgi:hypothetical protein
VVVLGSLLRPLVPGPWRWIPVGVVLLGVAGHELGWYRLPLPQNPRQVPPTVITSGGRVGALQFGFEMGTGLRTYMTSGLPHALAVGLLLEAPWWAGLLAGASFGAGRALMPLLRLSWRPVDAWDDALLAWSRRIAIGLWIGMAVSFAGLFWTGR